VLGALKLGLLAMTAKVAALAGYAYGTKVHADYGHSTYTEYAYPPTPMYHSPSTYGNTGYSSTTLYRKKRALFDQDDAPNNAMVLGEEEAFRLVHRSDASHCGERLVCELARRERAAASGRAALSGQAALSRDERSILELVQATPTDAAQDGARNLYVEALHRGYRLRPCNRLYHACPFSSSQIMSLVSSMAVDLLKDPRALLTAEPSVLKQATFGLKTTSSKAVMRHSNSINYKTDNKLYSVRSSGNKNQARKYRQVPFKHQTSQNDWRPIIPNNAMNNYY